MPTLLRIFGFRFYFFAMEGNEPPHVHIDKGSGRIKVWLETITVASSEGLKAAEIRTALQLTQEHQKNLLEAWYEFQKRKN